MRLTPGEKSATHLGKWPLPNARPFIVSWTKLDTGVFVLPETALGSYSLGLECAESASKRCLIRAV